MDSFQEYLKEKENIKEENQFDPHYGDELGNFYIVTKATPESTKEDVMMELNLADIMMQAKGGLKPEDIVYVGKNEANAKDYTIGVITAAQEGDDNLTMKYE